MVPTDYWGAGWHFPTLPVVLVSTTQLSTIIILIKAMDVCGGVAGWLSVRQVGGCACEGSLPDYFQV